MPKSKGSNGTHQKRVTRMQVMVAPDELRALDNFRFAARMPTRAAAVREVLRRGLAAVGEFQLASEQMHSRDLAYCENGNSSLKK